MHTIKQIEKGLDYLSKLIAGGDQQYLPLFETLHHEYQRRINRNSMLDLALKRAKNQTSFDTRFDTQNDTQLVK